MVEYSILIIDDDIWMQRILSKTLASYGFKKSYLASDGFEGISLAVENKPTLIICDILMPELSGHITLKLLKTIKATKDIPVIMVSALSDVENLGKAVKIGTAGFISKPFTRATVFDKLVDVFGKEKLELIQQGIPIEDLFYDETESQEASSDFPIDNDESVYQITDESKKESEPKKNVGKEKLLKHYQDDDKRSIESIKKMLLKTRKKK